MESSLHAGIEALKQNQIQEATRLLEHYCQQDTDNLSVYRLQAQMYLVRAYRKGGRQQEAIALCRQLVASEHAKVSTWARQTLPKLVTTAIPTPQPVEQNRPAKAKPQPAISPQQGVVLGVLGQTMRQSTHPSPNQAAPSSPQPNEIQLKSATTFKRHYEQEFLVELKELERLRQKMLKHSLLTLPFFGFCIITLPFLSFFSMFGIVLLGIYVTMFYQTFRKTFKEKVIGKILNFIDPSGNLTYAHYPANRSTLTSNVREWAESANKDLEAYQASQPKNQRRLVIGSQSPSQPKDDEIAKTFYASHRYSSRTLEQNRQSFANSRLFGSKVPEKFEEEDCVEGQWGATSLYFSEVQADRKRDSDESQIYFQGLFFQANFSKSFNGQTVVVPDFAEKSLGAIGRMFQSWNKQHADELIRLEDPEFERLFAVYGTDQIEARYILSTSLMQRLVELRKKVQSEMRISFVDNNVYIAIPSKNKNLFEPNFFGSVVDFQSILEYFETLQMMIGIVEDLQLNRRIWKQ